MIILVCLGKRNIKDWIITGGQKPCEMLEHSQRIYVRGILYSFIFKSALSFLFFTAIIVHMLTQLKIMCIGLWPFNVILYVSKAVNFDPSQAYPSSHRNCFKECWEKGQHTFLEAVSKLWL